jgi:hypothetical protein
MPTRHLVIAAIAAVFGLGALSAPTVAQTPQGAPAAAVEKPQAEKPQPKKRRVTHRAVRRSTGGQIACTPAGCHRIPPGCHPTQGYLWNGMPSGYDVVVCP